ncbi:divergent protein kinase domain 2A-like isoform X2 [Vespa velutina]|uniref:divergent protein kinase domain 2A-like isoform X2 n=1 Tax=Vespa velutina TaxID=202808 RepID=UPI001FB4199C|nr:divergent protein kinase domain 2A-like isoform X2 [Vespa velutina]
MILSYLYNIIKFKKCSLILMIGLFILYVNINININLSIERLCELHKCPACYGISECNYIKNINITLDDIFSLINYLFGVKNVFMGKYFETKVVLKKLAHTSELKAFDEMLCENKNLQFLCKNDLKINNHSSQIDFYELVKRKLISSFTQDDNSLLRLCPSDRNIDILFHNLYVKNKELESNIFYINLWTLVMINPEPLLLQILPESKGWPVPKYLGSCGRIIVEEYVGLPIVTYYDAPWIYRAKIISSLLNAAYMFTFKNKDFGFYLTDISIDNIAINSDGIAKFIDLENIIVVDKNILDKDICNHQLSDHNYYAICRILLSPKTSDTLIPGGFLHDIPNNILQQYPDLEHLIKQCAVYDQLQNRINKGQHLKLLLDTIIEKNNKIEVYNFI